MRSVADLGMRNQVRTIWEARACAKLGWLHAPSPIVAETLAGCGYDGLVIDLQHGWITRQDAREIIPAIEARGIEPFVRVSRNDPAEIGWLLDIGARGIIAPLINSAQEAHMLASAVHYPPQGQRSYGPRRPLLRHGAGYRDFAADTLVVLAMIETGAGLADARSILDTPGLDGVFIGPSDLAQSLGEAPAEPPADAVRSAIGEISEEAKMAGRRAGIFTSSIAASIEALQQGFDLVILPPDLVTLAAAARRDLAAVERAR
jgi:4-hydroxy-2-oxoheptanedioate aldolase